MQSRKGLYSVEWAGELITMMKQAKQAGLFDSIKHVLLPVGAAMDVLEGLGPEMPDNIWISGRYFFLYPETPQNKEWVASFQETLESLSSLRFGNSAYSTMYAFKKAIEAAGSKETAPVIQALEGMELDSPAGHRVFRKEDHQAMYEVPWGLTKNRSEVSLQDHGQAGRNSRERMFQPSAVRGRGYEAALQVVAIGSQGARCGGYSQRLAPLPVLREVPGGSKRPCCNPLFMFVSPAFLPACSSGW